MNSPALPTVPVYKEIRIASLPCIFETTLFTLFQFDLEKFISKNCNIYFSTRNLYIWAKILLNIVVRQLQFMFMFMYLFFFLKCTQRVSILQTVSNQEVTLKRLISMLPIAQKLYAGA